MATDLLKNNYKAQLNQSNAKSISDILNNSATDKLPSVKLGSLSTSNKKTAKTNKIADITKRVGGTWADIAYNINKGLIGMGEGVVDYAAGVLGKVSNNDDFQEKVSDFVKKDYTTDIVDKLQNYNPLNALANEIAGGSDYNPFSDDNNYDIREESYINDANEQGQNIVRGTAQAVGQILGMVAVSKVGGGIAAGLNMGTKGITAVEALNQAKKVGEVAGLLAVGTSAAGGGMAEALQEGATYDEAFNYGRLSGVGEIAIEGLSGVIGKGLGRGINVLPGVGTATKKVSTTIGGKVVDLLLSGASEGLEEVASDVVNPLFKMIYKDNYEAPSKKDMLQDFTVAGISSILLGGFASISNNRLQATNPSNKADVDKINTNLDNIEKLNTELSSINKGSTEYNTIKNRLGKEENLLKLNIQQFATKTGVAKAVEEKNTISATDKEGSGKVRKSRNMDEFNNRYGDTYSDSYKKAIEDNKVNYRQYTDKSALKSTEDLEGKDYDILRAEANRITTTFEQGKTLNKSDMARAYYIMDEMTKKFYDDETALNLLKTITTSLTKAGQWVQSAKMMNYFSPRARLDLYEKMANTAINKQGRDRKINKTIAKERKAKYYKGDIEVIKKHSIDKTITNTQLKLNDETKAKINEMLKDLSNVDNYNNDQFKANVKETIKSEITEVKKQNKFIKELIKNINESKTNLDNNYNEVAIIIPETIKEEAVNAKTNEEISELLKKVKEVIDAQHNATITEKLEAFRTFAMLFNFKTHARNFIGNVVMGALSNAKNHISSLLEKSVIRDTTQRTRTNKRVSKEVMNYARETFSSDLFAKSSKYEQSSKRIFNNKILERISKWNGFMLEKEDYHFLKKVFIKTYANWIMAKGYTVADISANPDLQAQGLDFAIKEAEIQTFKEASVLANKLNDIQAMNGVSRVLVGAAIPFKKTPINIVKVGFRYSPINLIKAFTYNSMQLKKGKIDINTYIDNVSMGLTGTSVVGIGFLLAQLGLLGIGSDDDKYDYDKTTGKQGYALKVGDFSYTMDWLSPSAIPLFTGVSIYEGLANENETTIDAIKNGMLNMTDPLTEMSMLSSLNSIFQQFNAQDSPMGFLGSFVTKATENYGASFIPTLSSQIAKVIDPTTRTSTATNVNNFGSKSIQKYFNTLVAKVPGFSMLLEPYVDCWGNEAKNYNGFATGITNMLENTVSPGWWSVSSITNVDKELDRLVTKTGDSTIIPDIPNSYYVVDGVRKDLNSKEYAEYKKLVGKTSYKSLQKIMGSSWYSKLDDDTKTTIIKKAYTLSRDYAKNSGKFSNIKIRNNFTAEEFTNIYLACSVIEKDTKYTKKENIYKYLHSLGLSSIKLNLMLDTLGY